MSSQESKNNWLQVVTYLIKANIRYPELQLRGDLSLIEQHIRLTLELETSNDQKFKTFLALYRIQVCLGIADQTLLNELLTSLEEELAREDCSKSCYITLINLAKNSNLVKDEIADLFAKYFNKINFRYGFHVLELGRVNRYLLAY